MELKAYLNVTLSQTQPKGVGIRYMELKVTNEPNRRHNVVHVGIRYMELKDTVVLL